MPSLHDDLPESLIDRIYSAALANQGWGALVPDLERVLRARVALFEQGAQGVSALAFCSHAEPRAIHAYESALWSQDCAMRDLRSAPVGSIVQDSVIVDGRREGRGDFYAGYLEALDGRCGLYGSVHRDRDSQFVISARRGASCGDFGDRERHLFALLTPHLGRAFRAWQTIRREREVATALLESMKHTGGAMVVVDRRMRVRFASDVARRRLCDAAVQIVGDTLVGRSPAVNQELRNAVRAVLSDGGGDIPTRVLLRSRGEGPSRSLAVTAFETDYPVDPDGGALAIVNLPAEDEVSIDSEALRSFFGLTAAEARLLTALVSGERLADYASRTGISATTAKSHLRAIFSKTGERRQVDLVRNVLALVRSGVASNSGTA